MDRSPAQAVVDRKAAAEHAGLTYVSDDKPGIRRHRAGEGFTYFGPGGSRISDAAT
jgi:DNA topoisomerase-1